MKKPILLFLVALTSNLSVAKDKWDTDGNNNLPANNKLGSKNNDLTNKGLNSVPFFAILD